MKQVDLWSGCKLYLLWLAVFISANYPLTTGGGKSGMYISKWVLTFRMYLISIGLWWGSLKWWNIKVHQEKSDCNSRTETSLCRGWWFGHLSLVKAPCHEVSSANAAAVHCRHHQPLLPLHSDVSSTQRLTQHYSFAWLVDQRRRQDPLSSAQPLPRSLTLPEDKTRLSDKNASWPCAADRLRCHTVVTVPYDGELFLYQSTSPLRVTVACEDKISKATSTL